MTMMKNVPYIIFSQSNENFGWTTKDFKNIFNEPLIFLLVLIKFVHSKTNYFNTAIHCQVFHHGV